jgi:hypothetical protein
MTPPQAHTKSTLKLSAALVLVGIVLLSSFLVYKLSKNNSFKAQKGVAGVSEKIEPDAEKPSSLQKKQRNQSQAEFIKKQQSADKQAEIIYTNK